MGARWSWTAICERGHLSSNFSGGADETCGIIVNENTCPEHAPEHTWANDCATCPPVEGCPARIVSEVADDDMTRAEVNAALWSALARHERATREHRCPTCNQLVPATPQPQGANE